MLEMNHALDWVVAIQRRTGLQLTTICYPQFTPELDAKNVARGAVAKRLFQPTDQTARILRAGTIYDYKAATAERGYDGYCLDTFHIRRSYGLETPKAVMPIEHLNAIASHSHEVHIGLGRKDIAGEDHIDTDKELKKCFWG